MKRDTTSTVASMLRQYPKTRDNDFLLILKVWVIELGSVADEELKKAFRILLKAYNDKEVSNFESIRRSRQKLQEENRELRGEKYFSRQEQGELFRKEINK
jgi:hypothetical protein